MENTKNIVISEMYFRLNAIQSQIDSIKLILDKLVSESDEFKQNTADVEKILREMNISEMKSHGVTSEEIVNWYWNAYNYESILVVTPNGNHPINYQEWCEGRVKNNKDTDPLNYKDFMIRVIDKLGYIQVIPF